VSTTRTEPGVHGMAGGAIIDPYQKPLSLEAAPKPS
jgi:hypothetical protein